MGAVIGGIIGRINYNFLFMSKILFTGFFFFFNLLILGLTLGEQFKIELLSITAGMFLYLSLAMVVSEL